MKQNGEERTEGKIACEVCGREVRAAEADFTVQKGKWSCPDCRAEEESCGCGDDQAEADCEL